MIIDEDTYLEHYGVIGMQWGVKKAKTAGRGAAKAGKVLGRGAKATGRGIRRAARATGDAIADNPDTTLKIAAGALFVGSLAVRMADHHISSLPERRFDSIDVTFRESASRPVSDLFALNP